jgi:3-methyladenine DNA glycosylase AlkD
VLRSLARRWAKANAGAEASLLAQVAEGLWNRGTRETMVLATMLLAVHPAGVRALDEQLIHRWLPLVDNWEAIDNFGDATGRWVALDPARGLRFASDLAGAPNEWGRRLALVSLLALAKRPDAAEWWPQVREICESLADERGAAVPKAVSWVLRSFARAIPGEVVSLLEDPNARLPAIARRETGVFLATGAKARPPKGPVGDL